MRGLRLYSAMLIGAIGLLGGCTHTSEIGVNKSGETLYLKTTCVPAFVIVAGLGGLTIAVDAPLYYIGGIAGGAAFDFLRCGLLPPKVSTGSSETISRTSGPKVKVSNERSLRETADSACLERQCAHLASMFTQSKYKECINETRC